MPTPPAKRPRKKGEPRKPSSEAVKAAAARAEARSAGEEIVEPKAPITPVIVPAEVIKADKAKAKDAAKRKRGRPTKYSPALGRAICKFIVHHRMSLREIGRRPLMPRESTILSWGMNPTHPFSEHFARAREVKFYQMFEDMVEIADDSRNDWMMRAVKDGLHVPVLNEEHLQRTKLRLETRWKVLARGLPKVFGDKVALEHTGKDGGPIETVDRPQPTGSDHLADITKRFAAKAPTVTVTPSSPAKPTKTSSGAGIH